MPSKPRDLSTKFMDFQKKKNHFPKLYAARRLLKYSISFLLMEGTKLAIAVRKSFKFTSTSSEVRLSAVSSSEKNVNNRFLYIHS